MTRCLQPTPFKAAKNFRRSSALYFSCALPPPCLVEARWMVATNANLNSLIGPCFGASFGSSFGPRFWALQYELKERGPKLKPKLVPNLDPKAEPISQNCSRIFSGMRRIVVRNGVAQVLQLSPFSCSRASLHAFCDSQFKLSLQLLEKERAQA